MTQGEGLRARCLACPLFLLPPLALPEGDQPDRFVGAHASHGPGGVHRAKDHTAAAQQELRRLDVAAVVLGPPGADRFAVLFGCPVGHGEGQTTLNDLFRLFQ